MAIECTQDAIRADAMEMQTRIYRDARTPRSAPLVLHLHGGGFVGGSLDAGRVIASLLAEAGAIVVSAAYPLAPEHRFPKALQASFGALKSLGCCRARWASKKSGLYVAGEEAGGNIAASLALMASDQQEPRLAGQILLSPMLDPCLATTSLRQAEAGPVGCEWADGWHQYLGSADRACHPYASPLASSRLKGVAPALILTAEDDPLRDEGLSYAKRLRNSGVAVHSHVLDAPTHWPGALSRFASPEAPWAATVRDRFVQFFTETFALFGAAIPNTSV